MCAPMVDIVLAVGCWLTGAIEAGADDMMECTTSLCGVVVESKGSR